MSNNTELEQLLNKIKTEKDTKIIPENIKKGVQIFNIEGTLESGSAEVPVKLFTTTDEMNADTTAKDGDLALVYANKPTPITNLYYSDVWFPKNVTVNKQVTEDISINAGGSAGGMDSFTTISGTLSASGLTLSVYFSGDTTHDITYTSTDGIHYTRTDTDFDADTSIYLGGVTLTSSEIDIDTVGCFLCSVSNKFEGLYTFKENYSDPNRVYAIPLNLIIDNSTTIDTSNCTTVVNISKLKESIKTTLPKLYPSLATGSIDTTAFISEDQLYIGLAYKNTDGSYKSFDLMSETKSSSVSDMCVFSNSIQDITLEYYKVDIDTYEIDTTKLTKALTDYEQYNSSYLYRCGFSNVMYIDEIHFYVPSSYIDTYSVAKYSYSDNKYTNIGWVESANRYVCSEYFRSPIGNLSDLTSSDVAQYKTVFGSNGVVKGDGTIYETMPFATFMEDKLGLTATKLSFMNGGGYNEIWTTYSSIYEDYYMSLVSNNKLHHYKCTDDIENSDATLIKVPLYGHIGISTEDYLDSGKSTKSGWYFKDKLITDSNSKITVHDLKDSTIEDKIKEISTTIKYIFPNGDMICENGTQFDIINIDDLDNTKLTESHSDYTRYGWDIYSITENLALLSYSNVLWVYNNKTNTITKFTELSDAGFGTIVTTIDGNIYIIMENHVNSTITQYVYKLTVTDDVIDLSQVVSNSWAYNYDTINYDNSKYCLEDDNYIYLNKVAVSKNADKPNVAKTSKTYVYYDKENNLFYSAITHLDQCTFTICNASVVDGSVVETNRRTTKGTLRKYANFSASDDMAPEYHAFRNGGIEKIDRISEGTYEILLNSGHTANMYILKECDPSEEVFTIVNGSDTTDYMNPIVYTAK